MSDVTDPGLEKRYEFSVELLQRKYHLYDWTEQKINSLISLNGLLIAAIFVLISNRSPWTGTLKPLLAIACVGPLLASATSCLWHIVPTMNSRRVPSSDLNRVVGSVKGIETYASNQEYYDKIMSMPLEEMIWSNVAQIRGMNKNIVRNTAALNFAAIATGVGLVALVLNFGVLR